jgi:hypothetical protein
MRIWLFDALIATQILPNTPRSKQDHAFSANAREAVRSGSDGRKLNLLNIRWWR